MARDEVTYWVAKALGTLAVLVWFAGDIPDPVAASSPVLKGAWAAAATWAMVVAVALLRGVHPRIVLVNALLICGGLRLGVDDEQDARIERLQAAAHLWGAAKAREGPLAAAARRDAAKTRDAEAKAVARAQASTARRHKDVAQAEERNQRRALLAETQRLQLAQSQLDAAERSKALEERRAEQAAAEAQRQSAEERACKEEKRRRAEAKVAAKETRALEETVARQEAQLAAAREAEAQAAREREAKEERQRAKAEAQRCRAGEKARRRQCPAQQPQTGHTKPCHTSTPPLEHARAVASPPPNAILGDALALALNQHVGRNTRDVHRSARAPNPRALSRS